ncbi:MAG TPA: hypothetical protein PK843_18170 [bacterium]|nr:hypothetical protein [bacterium]HPN36435.1 hypothetical protein [bacterium]
MKNTLSLMLLMAGMALAVGTEPPAIQDEIILPSIKIEKQAPRSSFEETLVATKSQTEGLGNAPARGVPVSSVNTAGEVSSGTCVD